MKVEQAKRLNQEDHKSLVVWAADCAGHMLPYFEEDYSGDGRPRKAMEAGRAWARGEISASQARAAALAAHAAARAAVHVAARVAARAAGYAAATAHVAVTRVTPRHMPSRPPRLPRFPPTPELLLPRNVIGGANTCQSALAQ